MLLWLADYLSTWLGQLQVVQYLTLRAVCGALTALLVSLLCGPPLIRRLNIMKIGQSVRRQGPPTHLTKSGTPTMGGTLILLAIIVSTILWSDLGNRYVWAVLWVLTAFGIIGFVDDYIKVVQRDCEGLAPRWKLLWQSLAAALAAAFLYSSASLPAETQLIVPFFKNVILDLGPWYLLLAFLVMVGSSNAVNLTDGLDGLAVMPCVLVAGALGVIAWLVGNSQFSSYLYIPYVPGAGELVIFCAALGGGGLGFLWFNAYPAQVFMGDVGALALGAALGVVAVIVRHEIVFFIMSGLFVVETVSVMLQVTSYKLTGRRLFQMAPLHHHYEMKGWPEPRIIVRFWIITLVLVLFALATLKLR